MSDALDPEIAKNLKGVEHALIERIRELETELTYYKAWVDDPRLLTKYKDIYDYVNQRIIDAEESFYD